MSPDAMSVSEKMQELRMHISVCAVMMYDSIDGDVRKAASALCADSLKRLLELNKALDEQPPTETK